MNGQAPQRILHLGLGAFHRAHQAVFLQRLFDAGDRSWQLAGGNLRPEQPDVATLAAGQGGAYTVETVAPDGTRGHQRIESIVQWVPFAQGWPELIRLGADAATRIVSFTVTEAGYDAGAPVFVALTALLRARRAAAAGPLTLLCCDNLRHNGDFVRCRLLQHLQHEGDSALHAWVQAHTSCPNAMVDRITPRPPAELRERVRAATGFDDALPVMAEAHLQWVIEDRFVAGRPRWQDVGVQLVDDVAPYEEAKIRLLNASHSAIAWAGMLAGHRFIHDGARDAAVRRFAHDYASHDAIPCLRPSPIDLEAYRDSVLERFGNAALADTNERVAADGAAKLAGFVVPTLRERLARGESIEHGATLPALYLACLQQWHAGRLHHGGQDQAMPEAEAHALCEAADPVAALCAKASIWGELAGEPRLLSAVRAAQLRVANFAGSRLGRAS